MSDIFISYSSHDREQAELLTEMLASAGLSVWIDQSGIGAATSWSEEIVNALDGCKAFIVMLSPNSIESKNVVRELALAFEKNKKILPLDLEPVSLPASMQYHLAGLQRTSMTNIDAIIRALGKLGLEATGAPQAPKIVKEKSDKKSLMILPFEDLSPTADNGWFADGIVSELIQSLSNIKSLMVADAQATKEFKSYKGQLSVYAREMMIRYFVHGDVRKFGDQIKINIRLLDIETGDNLWQESIKGTMADIFEVQEQVASKVLEGLKLHLTGEEKQTLTKRGTENAEAYELWMKGEEYHKRSTREGEERALAFYEEAVRLDPNFTATYSAIAIMLVELYRLYNRDLRLLDRANAAAFRVRELEGESSRYSWLMSVITIRRGDAEAALRYARRAIELDPAFAPTYSALADALDALGDKAGVLAARKEDVRLQKNNRASQINLLISLQELGSGSEQELRDAAKQALPRFERYVRLNPDDYNSRAELVSVIDKTGNREAALSEAEKLLKVESLDGLACYNLACLFLRAGDVARGLAVLRRSVEKGFQNIDIFHHDPDLAVLREPTSPFHAEFEALVKELGSHQNPINPINHGRA